MSKLADYQAAIVAALRTIPALAGLSVRFCVYPEDAFVLNLSKQSEIFVCHLGSVRTGPGAVNTRKQMGRDTWAICTVSTSFASPAAAQTQTGGTFDLCEAIREVQQVSIGEPGGKNEFLLWQSDVLTQAMGRSANGGGSIGYISEYHAPQRFF
jgi:hypothetical protein